jgi:hypothetical protein
MRSVAEQQAGDGFEGGYTGFGDAVSFVRACAACSGSSEAEYHQ